MLYSTPLLLVTPKVVFLCLASGVCRGVQLNYFAILLQGRMVSTSRSSATSSWPSAMALSLQVVASAPAACMTGRA